MTPGRMARARRVTLATAQAACGALLVAGVAWAGTQPAVVDRIEQVDLTPAAAGDVAAPSTTVALERTALVCPGPELLGLAGARDLELSTAGHVAAAPDAAVGDLPVPQGAPGLALVPLTDAARAAAQPVPDEAVISAAFTGAGAFAALGHGAAAPGLVATQETWAESEEVIGLATVACQQAASSGWLLGGGGGPGRAERIIISNPGSNAITARIAAYGVAGRTVPPDGQGVVVPPRGRTVLLADALAPDEASPAFEVTVDGGDAVFALVETAIEGTRPTGFDVVPVAQPPAQVQVIPGVLAPAADTGTVTVRILNPGSAEAIGTISVLTAAGELPLPDAVVRVPAASVVDVPVPAVPAGPTSLVVNADAPIVAAARTVEDRGDSVDAGWAVSQAPITGLAGAAVPTREGVARRLLLAAHGAGTEVEIIERVGTEAVTTTVLVPTDGTVVVPLAGQAVWVRPQEGPGIVAGAVLSTAADEASPSAISVLPLVSPRTVGHRSEVIPLG